MMRFWIATMILGAAMTVTALISLPEMESQTSCLSKLVPCFATLNTTTNPPSKGCCDSVKEALEKDLTCLCSTIYTTPGLLAQFNVTTTRCDIHTDLSSCSAFGTSLPKASLRHPASGAPSPKASLPPLVKSSWRLRVIIGVSAASAIIMVIVITVVVVKACNARRKNARINGCHSIIWVTEYSYANVKKMTKSFLHVLGKGGFGIVYKGTLPDGRDVAVKILKNPKEDKNLFCNELHSMSQTSHVNIVSLLGFCFEENNKALVYEYMPNGSLKQFISRHKSTMIAWDMSYDIVVGVSRGLEYLHNRSERRIVHFDIKPDNILLDRDFRPKIADFGLAKLCKAKESIMSMLDMGGTPGYIAPEVFSKEFGGVSYKADVYSFGMLILEMIGLRNRDKAQGSGWNNGSVYFPDWIYEDVETGEIMKVFGDQITEEEEKIAKKLVLVALWCIQKQPSDRPKMTKVIEMLEGDLGDIQAPPKPLSHLPALTVVETG